MNALRAHVQALNAERQKTYASLNALYDSAPRGGLTPDLRAEEQKLKAKIDGQEAEIRRFIDQEEREVASAAVYEANAGVFGGKAVSPWEREDREADQLRNFLNGAGPNRLEVPIARAMRERDAIRNGADPAMFRNSLTGDSGTGTLLVPTLLASSIYEVLEAEVAAFRLPTTKINTPSGAPLNYPKLTTHSIATQVIAQGSAIGGTDPVFDQKSLNVYKYGQLVDVSAEEITDASIDIVGLIARDTARAVGRDIDADLINGSGSGAPQGIMTAIAGAGTIHGTTAGITYDQLVDLQYSVNSGYRSTGKAAWLMRDLTAGTLRKLRDGAGGTVGAPLWKSNDSTGGMANYVPPTLLGDPAFTDPNVASV